MGRGTFASYKKAFDDATEVKLVPIKRGEVAKLICLALKLNQTKNFKKSIDKREKQEYIIS